jgi:hypothetical protein
MACLIAPVGAQYISPEVPTGAVVTGRQSGEMAMMDSVIIAAPLLIAALVMAVRFVGCGLDTSGTGVPESYSGTVSATSGLQGFWQLNDQR